MTHQQWEAIEQTLAGLSASEKQEVAKRILMSIREEGTPPQDRASTQRESLDRLCRTVDAMPAVPHGDGLSNRDHDRLVYTR
jgi:hypothetical protein